MLVLLIILLLFQAPQQTERANEASGPPEIEVRKFSWVRHRAGSNANWNSGVVTSNPINRKTIESRSRDLRVLEESRSRDRASGQPVDTYRYKIELRNSGARAIKGVFLDYQTSYPSDPDNPSHREFACAVKIKPNDNRSFVAESPLPPSRVVEAASKEILNERLILNRIEYADGTIWQRPDWHAPQDIPMRSGGPCRPI